MARHWALENPNSHIIDSKIFDLLRKKAKKFSDIYSGKTESHLPRESTLVMRRNNYGRTRSRGLEFYMVRGACKMKIKRGSSGKYLKIWTYDHIHTCDKTSYGDDWFIVNII